MTEIVGRDALGAPNSGERYTIRNHASPLGLSACLVLSHTPPLRSRRAEASRPTISVNPLFFPMRFPYLNDIGDSPRR